MDHLLDTAPGGYISFADNGLVIDLNATFCDMLGYSKAELQGYKFEKILNIAGRIFFQTHFFPMLKLHGKADEVFFSLLAKDGSLIPVVANSIRHTHESPEVNICLFLPVYNRRKYEDEIIEAKRRAEDALRENEDLKKARQEANQQARELDKQLTRLNAVNNDLLEFNNIIHHDMQECIRKIITFSKVGREDNFEDYLDKITQTAYKLTKINSSLKLFIRLGLNDQPPGRVDLNSIIREAKEEIVNETDFHALSLTVSNVPEVEGFADQLKLLFVQLFSNSIKFRKGNSSTIDISSVVYESNIYRNTADRYEYSDTVQLTIKDDGQGFDNIHKQYVFKLLKKIHAGTAGSGIGLAICKKIIENHNGEITISSQEGAGTTVTIILPVAAAPAGR